MSISLILFISFLVFAMIGLCKSKTREDTGRFVLVLVHLAFFWGNFYLVSRHCIKNNIFEPLETTVLSQLEVFPGLFLISILFFLCVICFCFWLKKGQLKPLSDFDGVLFGSFVGLVLGVALTLFFILLSLFIRWSLGDSCYILSPYIVSGLGLGTSLGFFLGIILEFDINL